MPRAGIGASYWNVLTRTSLACHTTRGVTENKGPHLAVQGLQSRRKVSANVLSLDKDATLCRYLYCTLCPAMDSSWVWTHALPFSPSLQHHSWRSKPGSHHSWTKFQSFPRHTVTANTSMPIHPKGQHWIYNTGSTLNRLFLSSLRTNPYFFFFSCFSQHPEGLGEKKKVG